MGADALHNVAGPPEAKIFGDLETSSHSGLSALSGKAVAISKCISKTLNFLETTLETCGREYSVRPSLFKLPSCLEHYAQRNSPRRRFPGHGECFGRAGFVSPSFSRRRTSSACRVQVHRRRTSRAVAGSSRQYIERPPSAFAA